MTNDVRGTLALTVLLCGATHVWGDDAITAKTSQRVHPVLIRNDENPLQQLTIEASNATTFLHAVSFDLAGTDKLDDLSSLRLFLGTDEVPFSRTATFGDVEAAGKTVVFRGNVRLRKGTNRLWLSCRLHKHASLTRRVDAQCTELSTSVGTVKPDDTTPGVRKRIGLALRRHNDDGVHTYRIPALATTKNGTLLCVYDVRRRKGRDLQEDIDIGLVRSIDGGQSWEAQQIIMDMGTYGDLPEEQNGVSDPGIIVDPQTGEIFVAAVWMWGKPGKHQWNEDGSEPGFEIGKSAQFLMVRSKDDGKTWSEPENLTRKLKKESWWLFAPSPQQGIALEDGTLVWPSQGRDDDGTPFSNLMISRDHGKTWEVTNSPTKGTSECQAVRLDNGSIMLNMRTERPTRFRSVFVTPDLGKTWEPHPTNRKALIEPNCNGTTCRFEYTEDGKRKSFLVFANPHSQSARDHHTIQLSFNDGMTWPERYRLLLDVGVGAGYPSATQVDEKHLGLVYEGSQSHLVFEKFHLDELLHPEQRW